MHFYLLSTVDSTRTGNPCLLSTEDSTRVGDSNLLSTEDILEWLTIPIVIKDKHIMFFQYPDLIKADY